jgi:PIN domain nuclease of toxin-antitoxin system
VVVIGQCYRSKTEHGIDRFIIAAAIQLDVPVVAVDPHFQQYGVEIVS